MTGLAASSAAVNRYDQFVRRFMAHGADAAPLLKEVIEADPAIVLGHCARGFCALILGRQELRRAARESLAAAESSLALRGGTARERAYVAALADFCSGAFQGAADRLDESLMRDPLDGYATKLVHAIRFMMGDSAGMLRSTGRTVQAWNPSVPDAGYVYGCHAFGFEETGDYAAAEAWGRRALEIAADDAWAVHAVAHVLEMRDEPEAGIRWLDSRLPDLTGTGNLAFHIHWHKALFLLELGQLDEVLELYDRHVRAQKTDDFRDVSNGVSLLLRLESAGASVGERWEELAEKAARRTGDMALVFAALHYQAALVATGRWAEVDGQLAEMDAAARSGAGDQARLFADLGLPFARAYAACCRSQDRDAAATLVACLPEMRRAGGSHAQRDLFFKMVVDSLESVGMHGRCRELLAGRLAERPGNRWAQARLRELAVAVPHAAE